MGIDGGGVRERAGDGSVAACQQIYIAHGALPDFVPVMKQAARTEARPCWSGAKPAAERQKERLFFFEKKKQKTFVCLPTRARGFVR
jgi:hypothetical protein